MEEATEHFVQCPSSGVSLKAAPSTKGDVKMGPGARLAGRPGRSCLFRETKLGHFGSLPLMSASFGGAFSQEGSGKGAAGIQ